MGTFSKMGCMYPTTKKNKMVMEKTNMVRSSINNLIMPFSRTKNTKARRQGHYQSDIRNRLRTPQLKFLQLSKPLKPFPQSKIQ
jgi:hypothetical protein